MNKKYKTIYTNKICQTCGKTFKVRTCYIKYHPYKFCSKSCYIKIGKSNPKWKGGKFVCDGYNYIYKPDHPFSTNSGYVCEHRLIMEKKIGRYLQRNEVVHHINGIRNDNRIENLILMTTSSHATIHFKGIKKSPEHIAKVVANRTPPDTSDWPRNKFGRFIKWYIAKIPHNFVTLS